MGTTLFTNAKIYTPEDRGRPAGGAAQGLLSSFPEGALAVREGLITACGDQAAVNKTLVGHELDEVDLKGRLVIPGFVDPHTHMCFAARREEEFAERLCGIPYLEILERGGGILASVRHLAAASEEELYRQTCQHAWSALRHGTTTLEIKSGYGLDTANELKMLRVIGRLAATGPQDIIATFLGAHAIPASHAGDPEGYLDLVIEEMLPAVKAQGIASQCDIFCERGVFSQGQARRLLTAAKDLGMAVKLHADEVHDLGGAGLAAELGARSADHLLAASKENLLAMARAGVVANLLPATAYCLKKPFADARFMITSGLPVALATDCNPGSSYTESMPFVLGLAILGMDMTPAEALVAATLNSAYSLGVADRVGSLTPGKQADFLVVDGAGPAIFAYHAGVSPVVQVYKRGVEVAALDGPCPVHEGEHHATDS